MKRDASKQTGTRGTPFPLSYAYNKYMNNFNQTAFNPSFPYTVVCPSAPFENTIKKSLDECWGLCLGLSEEYGYAAVYYGACLMGEYTNGQ